eukprot:1664233-Amphidinium_carterae.2
MSLEEQLENDCVLWGIVCMYSRYTGAGRLDPAKRKRAFRLDCAKIWGNRWDYSHAQYKDNHTPVKIGCPLHGPFWLRPHHHIQRRKGCPKCEVQHTIVPSAAGEVKPANPPRLGQHMLQSKTIADRIAACALPDAEPGAVVAEIGVGTGELTAAVFAREQCKQFIGFEIDESLLRRALNLRDIARCQPVVRPLSDMDACITQLGSARGVFFFGDFLACAGLPKNCQVAVGNLPYRIAGA